jgi:hypothetical protein
MFMPCILIDLIEKVTRILLLVALIVFSGLAGAEDNDFSFQRLLMPGDLIEGHAEFETQCDSCHGVDNTITQTMLCLDCHKVVAKDVQESQGLHGRINDLNNKECSDCHSDHLGRQGDILSLDKDSFNHETTDFGLQGKHANVLCTSCHLPDKKYSEAEEQCFSCHKSDDRHEGAFGEVCQDCHSPDAWSEIQFDHQQTEFLLRGKHQEIQCNACHPDEKYTDTPSTCSSCHTINDVHDSANGNQCEQCHSESSWGKLSFDHNVDTDFSLLGGHSELACNSCHQGSKFENKLGTECKDCHEDDDEHNGLNGDQCESCHSVDRWDKISFDHNSDTDFLLKGKHTDLSCENCHRAGVENVVQGSTCIDCHRVDDVHKGQQGEQCSNCHNAVAWDNNVQFNHDLSAFPLVGMHAVSSCDSCHSSKAYNEADSECTSCHQQDDSHKLALGPDCAACHNPNDWQLWLFDHDAQTSFQLDGAHQDLSCNSCHIKPAKTKIDQSSDCGSCHLSDDVHNRRFGRACDRCHTTQSFKDIQVQ